MKFFAGPGLGLHGAAALRVTLGDAGEAWALALDVARLAVLGVRKALLPFASQNICLFFSPVGFKGNRFHCWKYRYFSRGLKQMEGGAVFTLEKLATQNQFLRVRGVDPI